MTTLTLTIGLLHAYSVDGVKMKNEKYEQKTGRKTEQTELGTNVEHPTDRNHRNKMIKNSLIKNNNKKVGLLGLKPTPERTA